MQEVEVPFDEVVRPIREEPEPDNLKKEEDEDDNEIPDLQMDSMITSGSSLLEQTILSQEESIFRPHDVKSTSLMQDDEEDDSPDSPTASIFSASSSFDGNNSVAESSIEDHKVRLADFDDRFDHESAAFALVETMCAPVDLVCHSGGHKQLVEDQDDNILEEKAKDDDSYTFFPQKQEKEPKFRLGYAACGASNEDVAAPKSIMSEAMDSWNLLVKRMGNQLTMQEFMERPTPSFQSAGSNAGSHDS